MEKWIVGIAVVIFIALAIDAVHDRCKAIRREDALNYLLDATSKIYFYGRPVSMCLTEGVVGVLAWSEIGDYSKTFGCLILNALFMEGNETARLYWKKSPGDNALPEHYTTFVTFDFNNRHWELRLRARHLDQISFRETDDSLRGYEVWIYPNDVPRDKRIEVEKCSNPDQSYLAPDINYLELPLAEFIKKTDAYLDHSQSL